MSLETQLLDPRTSLHGVPESCHAFGDLTAKANMASECLTENVLSKHLYDAGQEAWLPMEYISFVYDVGEHGGVTAASPDESVPAGTIIVGGIIIVADKFVAASGTPMLGIGINSATENILVSTDICAASVNDRIAVTPLFANAATWLVATAATTFDILIASANLTAGRLYGYLMCFRNVYGNELSSGSSASSNSSSSSSSESSSSSSSSSSESSNRLRF
jgi:hypothetical protein